MAAPISLLDVIDAREAKEPRECLTHVLYIAKDIEDVGKSMAAHKRIVEETADATGIFMCQEGVLLHYLEAPPAVAVTILRQIGEKAKTGIDATTARVLHQAEDCPSRYFDSWKAVGPLSISDEGDVPVPPSEEAVDLAFEALKAIIAIGKKGEPPEHNCPSQKRIAAYCACKAFFSLKEYMGFFDTTISVNLESEDVWPFQPVINYVGF